MHSWQNGTRCRDGVKVLWCHAVLEQCWVCVVCWSLSYAVKFIAAEHGRYGSSFVYNWTAYSLRSG